VEPITAQERGAYFATFASEALRLEQRDVYATDIERDRFGQWLRGEPLDPDESATWWQRWLDLMGNNTKAGKTVRRLRIISEPVTSYIRFEWSESDWLLKAGEQVRWLPRNDASTLLLPGNDCWIFDRQTIVFTEYSGDGHVTGHTRSVDPAIAARCVDAFEAAWPLGVPHEQYRPT
jgi:hypothetical protein